MTDKLAYENRRAEFRKRPPTHYCGRCTSVLYPEDASCLECGAQPSPTWPELGPIVDPWLGQTIGERYLLTRGIGAGASGFVYRAESLAISRQFAIKIVPLGSDDVTTNSETIRARLNREIGALGQLRNPHIVSFYDVVPIGDSAVALLMDLIEGRTLQDVVWAAGSLDLGRGLKILRQIANGVHEAHEANMIHRDLKPDNIMIERLPAGDDFVHILDFGIVHRLDDVRVTQGFLGTPLYASPEQAVGGAIDRRADIYALGAVTFFMLTGKPPFDDDNVYKVLKAHVGKQAPRLSDVAPERYFPPEIEDLVQRMLAKKPEDRPQSLAAVIAALDKFAQHRPSAEQRDARYDSSEFRSPAQQDAHDRRGSEASSELNQTVASEVSLAKASSSEASRPDGAPMSAVFQRRKSDVSVPPLPQQSPAQLQEQSSAKGRTQVGVSAPRSKAVAHETDQNNKQAATTDTNHADLFELPRSWYGRELTLGRPAPGNFRADFQRRYWAILDEARCLAVGEVNSAEVLYFQVPPAPELTVMGQRRLDVVTGHADGSILCWSAKHPGGQLLHQNAAKSAITAIVCNESFFLFGTASGALYIGEFKDEPIQPLCIQSGSEIRVLTARAGRSSFAVARANGFIEVYNIGSPNIITQRISPPAGVTQLTFSQDGYLLAAVFEDKKLILYNALTGAEIARSAAMKHEPRFIHFDNAGRLVGECEVNGEIFGLDLQRHLFSKATA